MMVIQKCETNAFFVNYKFLRTQNMEMLIVKKTKEIATVSQL